jgi:ankyrin repeat protein
MSDWDQEERSDDDDDDDDTSSDDIFYDSEEDATPFDNHLYEDLEMGATLEEIRRIVYRRPRSVHWVSPSGEISMHLAARESGDLSLIRFLWEEWPASVAEPDAVGRLALHHAAGSRAPLRTIAFLAGSYPGALRTQDEKGRVPLHLAVQRKRPTNIIEYLVGQRPESIREVDSDGRTALHLVFTKCWANSPKAALVQHLIRACPDAIRQRDRHGYLPLHVAAREVSDAQILQLLVDPWPESVRVATADDGRFPLHLAAAASGCFRSLDSVDFFRAAWPESIRAGDSHGDLPLHLAAAAGTTGVNEIRHLVQAWPPSVQVANARGHLPVHVAVCRRSPPRIDAVEVLLDEHPPSAAATDLGGSTPLHLAATGGIGSFLPSVYEPWRTQFHPRPSVADLIRFLVEQAPASIQVRDRQGLVPLHAAAASDASLDALFALATAWPGAVARQRRKEGGSRGPKRRRLSPSTLLA